MWNSLRDELREVVWLVTVVGGLSVTSGRRSGGGMGKRNFASTSRLQASIAQG